MPLPAFLAGFLALKLSFKLLAAALAAIVGGAVGLWIYFGDNVKDVDVPPGACQCTTDEADVRSRIAEATAARDAFAKSAADRSAKEDGNPNPERYSSEAHEAETKAAHPAVKAATTARTAHAKTRTDCTTEVDEKATPCLRAALQTHENVHSKTCQAMKANGRVGFFGDYKFQMTMVTLLRNEAAGYEAEIQYLKDEARRCSWQVTYQGPQSREDQQQRLAASRRRATQYVAGLPALPS